MKKLIIILLVVACSLSGCGLPEYTTTKYSVQETVEEATEEADPKVLEQESPKDGSIEWSSEYMERIARALTKIKDRPLTTKDLAEYKYIRLVGGNGGLPNYTITIDDGVVGV